MNDPLRNFLDKIKPSFQGKGGLSYYFPIFDVIENLFYSSDKRTKGLTHVRDGSDIQRIMVVVWLATFPTMFAGMYNLGYQSLNAIEQLTLANTAFEKDWHWPLITFFTSLNPNSFMDCLVYGAIYFIPIYVVVFAVGIGCELIFALIRRHEVSEGAFVTTVLFSLSCPPNAPLWQCALGIAVGLVIGKEIFGGTGKNFLNPALTGRAFLYFAYPASWSGDMSWVAVDGYTAATILGTAAQDGYQNLAYTWNNAFLGFYSRFHWRNFNFSNISWFSYSSLYKGCLLENSPWSRHRYNFYKLFIQYRWKRNQSHVFYAFLVAHGNWWICFWLSLHGY